MRNAIPILLALACAACSNYSANLPSFKPYKMDVQQGNVVDSKMMMQLRPGMTRAQVRFIMGTPMLVDSFHANRWDYLYRMQKGGKVIEQRHVILEFEGDQLKRVSGDVIPAGSTTLPVAKEDGKAAAEPKKLEPKTMDAAEGEAKPKSAASPVPVAPAPAPAPEAKPAAQPVVEQPKPVAAEPAPEAKALAPALPESAPAAEPVSEPAAVPAPVAKPAEPAPVPAPAPAAKSTEPPPAPAAKPTGPAKTELKTAPKPPDDLPPEDDPGYFERMLEKIGF